jgi:molybdenum-dependent DNA-binding transcriptional regulator ModE
VRVGAWTARQAMDDSFRRQWAIQLAKERAEHARTWTPTYDEPERRPLERSRWLGLQVRSLLALVVVAEEGSFVQAAKRLGYSRSTISHQIAQLESAIGQSLVVRGSGSRSVTVTPAGTVVVAHGRAVLKVLGNAEAQLAELARRERGRRSGAGPAPGLSPAT